MRELANEARDRLRRAIDPIVTGTILFKRLQPKGGLWIGNGVQNLAGGLSLAPIAFTFDAVSASAYHFLMPPLGLFFGWLLLGEHVAATDLVGILPVALGV